MSSCCTTKANFAKQDRKVRVPLHYCAALQCFLVNPRRACAARVTVVGSVRLSVTQHLTSRTLVHLAIGTTYSTGSEGQKFCGVFSENALQS